MVSINNKVLVKILVPEIDRSFDLYLPISKKIGNIIELLNSSINELTDGEINISNDYTLYNYYTKEHYKADDLLLNTNIRNGTILILIN